MRMGIEDHAKLLRIYGQSEGNKCGKCIHLLEFAHDRAWFKCNLARVTRSAASDWRKKWDACGRFVAGPQEKTFESD